MSIETSIPFIYLLITGPDKRTSPGTLHTTSERKLAAYPANIKEHLFTERQSLN